MRIIVNGYVIAAMAGILALFAGLVYASTSDTFSVTLQIENRAPVINEVSVISSQDPTEAGSTTVDFWFTVWDQDYVANIDNATVHADFYKSGETNRSDALCVPAGGGNNTTGNYSCSIGLRYFDGQGVWTVYAYADDINSEPAMNSTITFTYNKLTAMIINTSAVSFGTTLHLGETDVASVDDPMRINNTGNADFAAVKATAIDLRGETDSQYIIPAGNFSVNINDAANGDILQNNTATTVTSAILNHGEGSTEELFFYLEEVPSAGITAQAYSTSGSQTWTLAVVE